MTLTANLVKPSVLNRVFFSHYSEVTRPNTVKLLLRASFFYHNREKASRILRLVTEILAVFDDKSTICRIMQDDSREGELSELRRTVLLDAV